MQRGELCHIPQSVLLLKPKDKIDLSKPLSKAYLKVERPIKALFWDRDESDPRWSFVFYKNDIWSVKTHEIYPI